MEGNFGRVPIALLRDDRIRKKEERKLIRVNAALWSFAGKNQECFPPIGKGPDRDRIENKLTICYRSGLGKNVVVQSLQRLEELCWISVTKKGQGYNNNYTLAMKGIYGRIPESLFHDDRIKKREEANLFKVVAVLWSFAGGSNTCYPQIGKGPEKDRLEKKETLCSRTNLSKNTITKIVRRLSDLGWIRVVRVGQGKNNTYTLYENPIGVSPNSTEETQNPKNEEEPVNLNKNEGLQIPKPTPYTPAGVPNGLGEPIKENITHFVQEHTKSEEGVTSPQEWNVFIDWAKTKLPSSSISLLKETKVILDISKARLILDKQLTMGLSAIVRIYFEEKLRIPIELITIPQGSQIAA